MPPKTCKKSRRPPKKPYKKAVSTICKYYANGEECPYGNRCKLDHFGPVNEHPEDDDVEEEVEVASSSVVKEFRETQRFLAEVAMAKKMNPSMTDVQAREHVMLSWISSSDSDDEEDET